MFSCHKQSRYPYSCILNWKMSFFWLKQINNIGINVESYSEIKTTRNNNYPGHYGDIETLPSSLSLCKKRWPGNSPKMVSVKLTYCPLDRRGLKRNFSRNTNILFKKMYLKMCLQYFSFLCRPAWVGINYVCHPMPFPGLLKANAQTFSQVIATHGIYGYAIVR